jgi:hypothetical protein
MASIVLTSVDQQQMHEWPPATASDWLCMVPAVNHVYEAPEHKPAHTTPNGAPWHASASAVNVPALRCYCRPKPLDTSADRFHVLPLSAAGQNRWMSPTTPKAYRAGQIVKLQVIVSTNHGGECAAPSVSV